jgi:hypothetical protein
VLLLLIAQATGLQDIMNHTIRKMSHKKQFRGWQRMHSPEQHKLKKACFHQTLTACKFTFFCFTAVLAMYGPLSSLPAFTNANLSSFDIFLLT